MGRLELEVERGPAAGQRFTLEGDWTIGSGENGPGALGGDRWLSTEHARIRPTDSGWLVEDLRSAEGTRVNGQPVRDPRPLGPRDTIELGSTRIAVLPPGVTSLADLPERRDQAAAAELRAENRRSLDSRRLGAFLVDNLLMLPIYLALRDNGTMVALLVAVALGLTYFFACESLWGQTLGKALFRLRVARADGRPLTPQAVSARTVLRLLDELFLGLVGMLTMVLSGGRRRRLGDLAAGTVVTRAAAPFKRAPLAGRNLLALLAYPLLWLAPAAALYVFVPEASMHPCTDANSVVSVRGEGSCLVSGGALTVANAGHTLHVPGLDVALAGASVTPLRGSGATYVVELELAVTNRGSAALTRNDGSGMILFVARGDGTAVPVSPQHQRLGKHRPFDVAHPTIAPGVTATGWVAFAVPEAILPYLTTPGSTLMVRPPSREGNGNHIGAIQLARASTAAGAAAIEQLRRF
jgi:uncharacterized RDD family membrane protein YckC